MTQAKKSVRMSKGFTWFIGVVAVLVLIFAAMAAFGPDNIPEGLMNETQVQYSIDLAVANAIANYEAQEIINAEEEVISLGFLVDELFLGVPFVQDIYSDRELNLFDGEIDFGNNEYDAEETFVLKDIVLLANEHDYEEKVYMNVPKEAVEYKMSFDSDLNTSLISEEDSLSFEFLGNELEVSEWNVDSVKFFQGVSHVLSEGESITFDDKEITLILVGDDEALISVGEDTKELDEGEVKTINGIQVKLEYAYETSDFVTGKAKIIVAEDIENEVFDGDEYAEDSPWNWVIGANSLGIILAEDFDEVDADGDKEFQAIGVDESLCLPNDYVCIKFNGISEDDAEEVSFRLDELDGNWYVRTDGNFLSGLEDYSRVYINATGIYDRDLVLIDSDEVELEDSGLVLERKASWIVIEDFRVNYDLNVSKANGVVLTDDETHLSEFGISIVNPEDSAEDNEYSITVPEEKLEGSFSLI